MPLNFHIASVFQLTEMTVNLQRKRIFSCAHRYWNPLHEASWNAAYFGPLAEIHGHNYTVTLTVSGGVDPVTGIVVNLVDVKEWLAQGVAPFENRCVDAASAVMGGLQPSTENIARVLWSRVEPLIGGSPARLDAVRVAESEALWSEFRGETNMVYVTRVYDFSAAHRLHAEGISDLDNERIFGKCNRPGGHGHNYVLEVTVKGQVDAETGFAYHLETLDRVVTEQVLDAMDHRNLNTDVPQFAHLNPTTENLAIAIWDAIGPAVGEALHKVRVQETARNAFEYFGE
jgi:6-pyruvoyltetrahydropterin/6-carboxytetrahydropterin synthase